VKLAKPHIDVGLFTNRRDEQLAFWQSDVGLEFDHIGKLGGGVHQLRHHVNGSILKINHARDPLPSDIPPAGWRTLLIAREGISEPRALVDPDGNEVTLVPPGYAGITGIGLKVVASDPGASARFYERVFGAAPVDEHACCIGDSVLQFVGLNPGEAGARPEYKAVGLRYITVQIFDCDAEHARMLALGAEEGQPARTIGTTTRYSFVRDLGGNWIEVSQRFELTEASQ
jgi:lactoylglutathione lyase